MNDFNPEEIEGLGHEEPTFERDDRVIPFAMIPMAIILDKTLGASEMRVYAYVVARCGQKNAAWASQKTIGEDLGISRTRVNELLAILVRRGLLVVSRSNHVDGKSNVYRLPKLETVYGDGAYWGWNDYWKGGKRQDLPILGRVSDFPDRGVSEKLGTGVSVQAAPQIDKEQVNKDQIQFAPEVANSESEGEGSPSLNPQPAQERNRAVMGVFGGSTKEAPDPKDVRKQMYREAKEQQKADRKAEADAKRAGAVSVLHQKPENVSQIEWDLQKGPARLHAAFKNWTELKFGYAFVSKMSGKDIGQWKVLIGRLGSADKSLKFVEFVIDNWDGLKEQLKLEETTRPSIGLLVSGWYGAFLTAFQENGEEGGKATLVEKKHKASQDLLDKYTIKD